MIQDRAFVPYRTYRRGDDGVLHHYNTGSALGAGPIDLGFIVEGERLRPGDVIEINQGFILILDINPETAPPAVDYEYLPPLEDLDHVFGDGPWSPMMITRLRKEASAVERFSR